MLRRTRRTTRRGVPGRLVRGLILLALIAFILGGVGLHLWAARFESQATEVVEGLSQLRIGGTSKQNALERVPGLERSPRAEVDRHEAYEVVLSNPVLFANVLHEAARRGGPAAHRAAYLYGVRHWWLAARVEFRDGVVDDIAYGVRVSSSEAKDPWHVFVNVGSLHDFEGVPITAVSAVSPDYRVTNFSRWPEQEITVAFTKNAAHELTQHAFDLRLNCIRDIGGCSTAAQMLPKATADREVILKAAGQQY